MQNSKVLLTNGSSSTIGRRDQSAQVENHSSCDVVGPSHASTPNNNTDHTSKCSAVYANGSRSFSGSISPQDCCDGNYENVIVDNNSGNKRNGGYADGTNLTKAAANNARDSLYGTIRLTNGTKIEPRQATPNGNVGFSLYENIALSPARNNNQNHSMPKKHSQLSNSCEMIENKLAISNDDLLEAIEQLSMLSKSKEVCVTPKRNNSEKDNAKSNEVKADKERKQIEEEDRKKYIEFLQNEKLHILGNMDALKRSVSEIEIQEEEIHREVRGCYFASNTWYQTNILLLPYLFCYCVVTLYLLYFTSITSYILNKLYLYLFFFVSFLDTEY